MENNTVKICPICRMPIAETDAVQICPTCGYAHHAECWNNNQGCGVIGCPMNPAQSAPQPVAEPAPQPIAEPAPQPIAEPAPQPIPQAAPAFFCPNCGAPSSPELAFCAKCGAAQQQPKKNICSNCGTELAEEQAFCPKCGQKAGLEINPAVSSAIDAFNANVSKQKKKVKLLPIILAAALTLTAIFGIIGYNAVQKKKEEEAERLRLEQLEKDIEEYKQNANTFYTQVLKSGGTMEDIGNEIYAYWKAYVNSKYYNGKKYYSPDSAIEAALSHEATNVSTVKNMHSQIEELYKKLLIVPDTDNQQLMEIKEAVKSTYEAYLEMYDCVISPSGSYNSWTAEFSKVDNELAAQITAMKPLIG